MITTTIKGGLGNQMFQYAAGYALSRRLGVAMQLDLSFYNKQDKRKFELSELCIDFETHSLASKGPMSKKPKFWSRRGASDHSYVEPSAYYDITFDKVKKAHTVAI